MHPKAAVPADTLPLPSSCRRRPLPASWGVMLGAGTLLALSATAASTPASQPEGSIERQTVVFEAPDAACESYADSFPSRIWQVGVPTRAAFARLVAELPLADAHRRELLDPTRWSPNPQGGFDVRPTGTLLRDLSPVERAALYALLARWEPNKPERWPIVFPDQAALTALRQTDLPPALLQRVDASVYPFAQGLAFSDFSLLAEEFPDRAVLIRFLQATSATTGFIPRLRLRNALSVTSALAYWTVDNNNPFARPMLEALMRGETTDGVELTSLLPGAMRVLSHDINPDQVRHDASLMSFMISASLGEGPQLFAGMDDFDRWFERNFLPVAPPYRFGDLLVLDREQHQPVRYACAFVAEDFVFAKDPVALGLWRFLKMTELLDRNPHLAGGTWRAYRRRSMAAPAPTDTPFVTGAPGPWGVLRSVQINLEPPDRWLDASNIFRRQSWEFPGPDWNRIETLFRHSGLTPAQLDYLLDPANRQTTPAGDFVLQVPAELRLDLSPASRTALYDVLGENPANPMHYLPLPVPEDETVIARADLNPTLREALRRLCYRRQNRLCLSDGDALAPFVQDQDEARRLKRFLFSAPVLQVELARASLAFRPEVLAYWQKDTGRGPAALLRWFDHSPDLPAIDLGNFLPPIPQQMLNSFPDSGTLERTNCYWTSLNFFRREPDNRFLFSALNLPSGPRVISEELQANYRPVTPPYRFGDILCFEDNRPGGSGIIHMMNYVADNIVLSKNGFSALAPTVLMRLDEVAARYPTVFPLEVRGYRRQASPPQP